jgi:hypothetical protein
MMLISSLRQYTSCCRRRPLHLLFCGHVSLLACLLTLKCHGLTAAQDSSKHDMACVPSQALSEVLACIAAVEGSQGAFVALVCIAVAMPGDTQTARAVLQTCLGHSHRPCASWASATQLTYATVVRRTPTVTRRSHRG